jgi:hypothetical protein
MWKKRKVNVKPRWFGLMYQAEIGEFVPIQGYYVKSKKESEK